jgi:glycosyltransferase involved in cell wall biosynthesis
VRVVIAVLTYRRPDDLAELLNTLREQRRQHRQSAAGRDHEVDVLVVDNDPDEAGRPVCRAHEPAGVRYVPEPRPGIAAARNRALDEARDHDVLIFIDDDERPTSGWLTLLTDAFRDSGRVGVVGPVVSRFAVPLEPWVAAGGFFDRRRLPTGTDVTVAATNNLLLDLRGVRAAGVRFDERFGLSGGSDTMFVRQLVRAQGPLVWCDEAVVTDVVPATRCTRSWATRRAFRMGNSWSRTAVVLEAGPVARLRRRLALTGSGAARVAGGAARFLLGVPSRDLARRAAGVRTCLRGAGMLLGAYGYAYVEYRRRPSKPA